MIKHRIAFASYLMAFILACDQMSKWWIVNDMLRPPTHSVEMNPYLNFTLAMNRGVTFGLLNHYEHNLVPYLLIGTAIVIVGLMARWLTKTSSLIVSLGLAGIMGGAVGNIIDRLRYGAVVDFIDVHIQNHHWYTFNIADSAIVVGVSLLILDGLVRGK